MRITITRVCQHRKETKQPSGSLAQVFDILKQGNNFHIYSAKMHKLISQVTLSIELCASNILVG